MPKGDGAFLAGLLVFSALAFLIPALRTAKFAGVAYFGWWMAALMFLGPLWALLRMLKK
ncbi:MAG: hypothetical protein ABIJ96_11405 [Elusimicrobiota bacterium]